MKISGTAILNAPVDQVWAAFNDPAVLARTIPGCQELREMGPDVYGMTVTAGVASIKGTYEGNVALTELDPPGYFVLKAAGAGVPGTMGADVKIRLLDSATGGTDLTYDADAVVGGVIGGVGQRMLTGVAKKMAGQFFAAVDADIAGLRAPGEMAKAALVPSGAAGGGVGAVEAPGRQITYPGTAAGGRPGLPGGGVQGKDFLYGSLVGAAIALAGVAVGRAARRR
jgi:uncharacterized protein